MCGGPTYDTAKGQPRTLNSPDFLTKKNEISISPNGEPQNTGPESVLRLTPPHENLSTSFKVNLLTEWIND